MDIRTILVILALLLNNLGGYALPQEWIGSEYTTQADVPEPLQDPIRSETFKAENTNPESSGLITEDIESPVHSQTVPNSEADIVPPAGSDFTDEAIVLPEIDFDDE